jgi:hypothetical protein
MVFSSSWRSTENCDCDETDRLREENERLYRQEKERREAVLQESRERIESSRRSADDWREALGKQANLYGREADLYPSPDENGIDDFAIASEACKRACEIWDELALAKQDEIAELEARLVKLRDSIRLGTCNELRQIYEGHPGQGYVEQYLIDSLEEGGDPEDWLNW